MKNTKVNLSNKLIQITASISISTLILTTDEIPKLPSTSKLSLLFTPILTICLITLLDRLLSFSCHQKMIIFRLIKIKTNSCKFVRSSLGLAIAPVGFIFLAIGSFTKIYQLFFFLFSFILILTSATLIIEKNTRNIFDNYSCTPKLFLWSTSLISVLWSRITTSAQINDVFQINYSHFPFTTYILIAYNILKFILPIVTIIFIVFLIASEYFLYEKNKICGSFFKKIIFWVTILMVFSSFLMNNSEMTKKFIERTALNVDFDRENLCTNPEIKKMPLIFLNDDHKDVFFFKKEKNITQYGITTCNKD